MNRIEYYKIIQYQKKELNNLIKILRVVNELNSFNNWMYFYEREYNNKLCLCDIYPCILVRNNMITDKNIYHCVAFERNGCVWRDK